MTAHILFLLVVNSLYLLGNLVTKEVFICFIMFDIPVKQI